MKKIITALGNPTLNNELRRYEKYDVLSEDLLYQEAILDCLDKEEADVIIISALLQGDKSPLEFAESVKEKCYSARVILIVENISEEDKNILVSKGIFDILKDQEIEIEDVIDAIDREMPINIKAQIEKETAKIKEALKNESKPNNVTDISTIVSKVQKQEIISVFGTNGAGKSTIAANLVKNFSKVTKAKILLIDFDTINGNLDEILKLPKIPDNIEIAFDEDKKCGLNYAADLYLKNKLDPNVLDEIVVNGEDFDFMSGNTSLHYCQNVLNEDFYNYLIKCAKEKYDFIFLDLSSNIFVDSTKWALKESSKVLFVTENTNVCLKKSIQLVDTVVKVWNVYKEKLFLVINRYISSGIDVDIFSEVLKMNLIGCVKNNMAESFESYEKILETIEFVPKNNFLKRIAKHTKLLTAMIGKN